jgi:glycosyltransferase involved in cell wall biosynthesis
MKLKPIIIQAIRRLLIQSTLWFAVWSLYAAARLRKRRIADSDAVPCRVVHISPRYFGDRSYVGGGERYAINLAKAMANQVETVLVSFGDARDSYKLGALQVEIYPAKGDAANPISLSFLQELQHADVVHCHQYRKIVSNLAILFAAALGKPVFVTDHGGWSPSFVERLPIAEFVESFLTVSSFSAKSLPSVLSTQPIYGGIDDSFVTLEVIEKRQPNVLFVGRLLPHKGINDLIDAVDPTVPLTIIGRVYDDSYFSRLKTMAAGKAVQFMTTASDDQILQAYRQASVTVLPSVYTDLYGGRHPAPELLGLVLLESMACGTPVICTNVGGMPEVVIDGVTGFVVPPNDPQALGDRIHWLLNHPQDARQMGRQARARVLKEFTWETVAQRCLNAYTSTTSHSSQPKIDTITSPSIV